MLTRTGYADDVTALAIQRLASRVPDLQMTVSSEVNSLRVLRRALTDWIVPLQPRPDDLDAIHMAAVEIVTNAIEHAYRDAASGPIDFALQLTDSGELECRVADYGTWRPPTQAAAERGNGLMVARHLVDQLQVTHPRAVRGAGGGSLATAVTLRHRLMSPTIPGSPLTPVLCRPHSAVSRISELSPSPRRMQCGRSSWARSTSPPQISCSAGCWPCAKAARCH